MALLFKTMWQKKKFLTLSATDLLYVGKRYSCNQGDAAGINNLDSMQEKPSIINFQAVWSKS